MTQAVAEVELLALSFEGDNMWTLQIAHNDLMEAFLDNGLSSGRFLLSKVYQGEKPRTYHVNTEMLWVLAPHFKNYTEMREQALSKQSRWEPQRDRQDASERMHRAYTASYGHSSLDDLVRETKDRLHETVSDAAKRTRIFTDTGSIDVDDWVFQSEQSEPKETEAERQRQRVEQARKDRRYCDTCQQIKAKGVVCSTCYTCPAKPLFCPMCWFTHLAFHDELKKKKAQQEGRCTQCQKPLHWDRDATCDGLCFSCYKEKARSEGRICQQCGTMVQVSALLKQCSCFKLFCQHCFDLHILTHGTQQRTQEQHSPHAADFDEFLRTIFGARGTFGFSGTQQQRTPPGSVPAGMFLTSKEVEAFKTLGLEPTKDVAAIKATYKRLIRVHHPDAGGDVKRSVQINQARDVLKRWCKNGGIVWETREK